MQYIAHRGVQSKHSKENTLEAIMLGDKNPNIDGVEIDVRLTKDKQVVVIHDDVIDRVSDGKGKVRSMSLKRLKLYNYGTIIKPSTINTLDEVLAKFSVNSLLLIEIKDEGIHNLTLADKVLEIIAKYPYLNIWIQSFSLDIINYIKTNTNYKVGLLIKEDNQSLLKQDVDFFSISKNIINYDLVSKLINNKKQVMTWTIKSVKEFKDLTIKLKNYIDDIYIIGEIQLNNL